MAKAVRGTKRHCRNCGSKFYDLDHDPIVCPICNTVYELETTPSRAPVARERPQKEEPAEAPASPAEGPEIVSLEDVEEPGAAAEDEEDIDLGEGEEDIPDGEDEDVFLEDDEEDEGNVTGFIGGDSDDEER